jgi:predicted GNAT family acetyltransferase
MSARGPGAGEPQPLPTGDPPLRLHDDRDQARYEARIGDEGHLAALLDYRMTSEGIALLHTEVQEGYEGRGIGSRFVRMVFDDVRTRGLKIIPKCPFVLRWLERHAEQHDLLVRPLGPAGGLRPGGPIDPA